jgi:hypothetical protein
MYCPDDGRLTPAKGTWPATVVQIVVGARPRRHRGGMIYQGLLVDPGLSWHGEVTADG